MPWCDKGAGGVTINEHLAVGPDCRHGTTREQQLSCWIRADQLSNLLIIDIDAEKAGEGSVLMSCGVLGFGGSSSMSRP